MAVETAAGAGPAVTAPARRSRGGQTSDRLRTWGLGIWSALALLYLFIPVFIVVLFSFNDNKGRFNFTWQGFTLRHWEHPFSDPDLAKALTTSLEVALLATVIATALGTFMAMALVRYRFRGRSTVDFFVFMPLSSPEVVLGAALLALFLTLNVNTGFVTIVIAHVMFCVSYVVVTVKARLEGMDRHIEEAAMDLGGDARRRALGRRLRDHLVQRGPDADVPALHLRRDPSGRARRGQRPGHHAAARRARADGRQRARPAGAGAARRGQDRAVAAR
jgi:spermidine/putrescine transport system permease protein